MAAAVAVLAVLWLLRSDAWSDTLAWVQAAQRDLHRQLAFAMRAAAREGSSAAWILAGLGLLYGVFHAAGPGHGKAVIATYLGSSRVLLGRGILLSTLAALVQGITAIVLVEAARGVFGLSMRDTQHMAVRLENASFALVALLGAMLALRSGRALWRRARAPADDRGLDDDAPNDGGSGSGGPHRAGPASGAAPMPGGQLFSAGGRMQPYCADCGAQHGPSRRHIAQPLSLRTAAAVVLSIGLRPCTGAVLVLLVAYSLNMRLAGIAAVFAMSLGTAATVGALAALTVFARGGAFRLLQGMSGGHRRLQLVFDAIGLGGGLLIASMGIGLLNQGLQAPAHPLF
ncbi:nickel/cobalt transporter [Pigmentiphaga soli]|uniref:Nickel/cobalt efflux system n=1 Tax=Pigmentiphaga soli TaxID=1007095 RepID=A0ABP8HF70_9BURK